jgi:restriction system protein
MFGLLRSFFGFGTRGVAGTSDVRAMSWRQFEWVVREGFRRRGYAVVEKAGDGADVHVDLILRKDGEKFFVQCKQWKAGTIGAKPIRELFAVVSTGEAAGGIFVTAGAYTDEARRLASETSIDLINGSALEQLVLDARRPEPFMDPTEGRRQTSFKKLDDGPQCPVCGGAMVKRTAVRGRHKGADLWACLQYPQCRGMREG